MEKRLAQISLTKSSMTQNITIRLKDNKKVLENYVFMTMLQVLNSLFYFIIYPFLIRTIGKENFGLYTFVMSVVGYFVSVVSFGFDYPAAKEIAQNVHSKYVKQNTLSCIFTAKIYLEAIALIIFTSLIFSIPFLYKNWELLSICFFNTVVGILFPNWYFQGIQRMRIVTFIQIFFKLVSLPLIFWFISDPKDITKFAIIVTSLNVIGGLASAYIIYFKEKIIIRWMPYKELKVWFKNGLPFFFTTAVTTIKLQSIPVIIGALFSMSDVALYDLAYKIFLVPQVLLGSINGALFPKIVATNVRSNIKKILRYELLLGLLVILIIAFWGKWIICILGTVDMLGAYPIAVALSFGCLTFLLVGAYISFIFVPQEKYILVSRNQIFATIIFFVFTTLGLILWKNILSIAIAWSIAQLSEILYCKIMIKKYKLF